MEKRQAARVSTDDEVDLAIGDVAMRGRLRDLAVSGCMIECACEAVVGDRVEVTLLQGVLAEGEIVWAREPHIGIRFYRDMGEATVNYFRLHDWKIKDDAEPTDAFGRPLPPLPGPARMRASGLSD